MLGLLLQLSAQLLSQTMDGSLAIVQLHCPALTPCGCIVALLMLILLQALQPVALSQLPAAALSST
jgi:hypothetical protein